MSPKEYIESQLQKLTQKATLPASHELVVDQIFKLIFSKKFRKYAASEDLIKQSKSAIADKVSMNEPINITFLHGAYKLWRLKECPEVDWAELFAVMYYTKWVKGVCAIYAPGVHFDFFVDDWIVPIMNNVPESDIEDYLASYQKLLLFIKNYQPDNLQMSITPVGSRFSSKAEFKDRLQIELDKIMPDGLPELSEALKNTIELNTNASDVQLKDMHWQQKVWQIHLAYSVVKKSAEYHTDPNKILAFTQPLPSGKTISVGTTKSSVAKFWVGIGALQKTTDAYKEVVLSPGQLQKSQFEECEIRLAGLEGRNFNTLRIFS